MYNDSVEIPKLGPIYTVIYILKCKSLRKEWTKPF